MILNHSEKVPAITIAGDIASGKTTAGRSVAKKLGFEFKNVGFFVREEADKLKIPLNRLQELMEQMPSFDREIDQMQKAWMNKNENFVADSRLGWYFAPRTFKVFLRCDENVAADRIFASLKTDRSRSSELVINVAEVLRNNTARVESERARYFRLYDIKNHQDPRHFDRIVDTTRMKPEQVPKVIIAAYRDWINGI